MTQPNPAANDWSPCEPGRLQTLQERLSVPAPSAGIGRTAGFAAAVFLAAMVAVGSLASSMGAGEPDPISCREVRQQLMAYAAGECSPELKVRIKSHIGKCGRCKKKQDSLADEQSEVVVAPDGLLDGASLLRDSLIRLRLEPDDECDECR